MRGSTYTAHQMRPFATKETAAKLAAQTTKILNRKRNTNQVETLIEDTFGPNPCQRLTLRNEETGETYTKLCDGKRCPDCAPRKLATMQAQLRSIGDTAWIHRYTNRTIMDRALEAAKKRKQRNGEDYVYQIVGDHYNGWILVSDEQLHEEQRLMNVSEWLDRIRHNYQYSDDRIRRSRCLGRMSLVPLRRGREIGDISPWAFQTGEIEGHKLLIHGQLQRHMANVERLGAQVCETTTTAERESLRTVLPIPY